MIDRVEVSVLLDFYGSLLTNKQQDIMDLYYNDDLSLSEIAELNNTSRQAIYDLIKRCYKQLTAYENKLFLMKNSTELSHKKQKALEKLQMLDNFNDKEIIPIVKELKDILEEL